MALAWLAGACGRTLPELPKLPPGAVAVVAEAHRAAVAASNDAAKTVRLGMTLEANGQPQTAIACYERAVQIDAARFDAQYLLGRALAANGEHERAVKALRGALALRPQSAAATFKLAEAERERGQAEASAALLRAWIAREPTNATAHYLLGRATQTAAPLEQAIALFPRYGAAQFALAALYRKAGEARRADELMVNFERDKLTVPLMDDPEGAAVAELAATGAGLLRRAQRADAAGDLAGAIALHRQALEADPTLADAWINLVALLARAGGDDAAVERAYRRAVELAPGRAEGHYNFGVFCLQRQRRPEARAAFEAAVRADPRHTDALVNLGSLAGEQGRMDEAAAYFQRAAGSARAQFHLGQIQAFRGRRTEAVAALERGRSLAAGDAALVAAIDQELARLRR